MHINLSGFIVLSALLLTMSGLHVTASGQGHGENVDSLIESSCLYCHDDDTDTPLNFESLGSDLQDEQTFRQWAKVFDRMDRGEMPPKSEPAPDATVLGSAVDELRDRLRDADLSRQAREGRVPFRRLTRLEYAYALQDLLSIEDNLISMLPAEEDTGGFDTVGNNQRISPVHIRSYLAIAEHAIDVAINLDAPPRSRSHVVDYVNSPYVNRWHDMPLRLGGSVTKKLDDAVVIFLDLDYLLRSDACGLRIATPGYYRISTEVSSYQADTPVTMKLIRANEQRGGAELLGAYDVIPEEPRSVELTAYLYPGDYIYPSVVDAQPEYGVYSAGGAANYRGEGLAVKSLLVDGPLVDAWPPESTVELLSDIELIQNEQNRHGDFRIELPKSPEEHVRAVLTRFAPLAFRRPVEPDEIESFVELALPAIETDASFEVSIGAPLRAILSSPQFLFFHAEPGELDDYALATRLSFFLWKSVPDDELLQLAAEGKLSDPDVLAEQVDRLLNDEKSRRFVQDFLGQWLKLYDINATTPDEGLYPEFDDILNQAILAESELFFTELIREDLAVSNLIDSDFTYLNRRLAEHYGVEEIAGQEMMRVTLPEDSPRGGILTQASVLKVTANGTVTSPVTRGNYVLTNLLGQPPSPPPPSVGSIEPDTRGTTTIRETLDAHRHEATCAICHQHIDPPGFALESFDPIGGFRTKYRIGNGKAFEGIPTGAYIDGPAVDASGVTPEGEAFADIIEFKSLLITKEEQIARHFVSQLIVYSTGGEIGFADRELVEQILDATKDDGYPIRTLIHDVVQSRLFRQQ